MSHHSRQPDIEINVELDVSGYHCPIPLLRTKKALAAMKAGEFLRVVATDRGSEIDFKVFTERSGHELLSFEENDGRFVFLIRKNERMYP